MMLVNGLSLLAIAAALNVVLQIQIRYSDARFFTRPDALTSVGLLLLTCPFVTLIHELGHVIAGKVCRQACLRVAIGPIEFAPVRGVWLWQLVPIRRLGVVSLAPSTFDAFAFQRAVCCAGGPVASAVAAPFFLYFGLHAQSQTIYWAWAFCLQWALVGILSLAPLRLDQGRSDGYNLWEAIRGGQNLDRTERDLLTPASHATPLRVADWPTDLLERLGAADRFNAYLNYIHFLDKGDAASAGPHLEALLGNWMASDPPEYALEAAYFYGFHRRDLDAARSWLDREKRNAEPWVGLRAQAAAYPEQAPVLIAEALKLLRIEPPCGAYQYEIDRLTEMATASDRRT